MAEVQPPPPPRPLAGLSKEEQAKAAVMDYARSMEWGAELASLRADLIEWVNRLYNRANEEGSDNGD